MSRGRADRWQRDPSQNASDKHGAVQFGTVRLVRHWGQIGTMQGRELAQDFPTEEEAAEALERIAAAKRRRGYQDL